MKTRFDFVSNSSSCSFIVHDAKSAMMAFKKEFGKNYDYSDMPYGIEDINFSLIGNKQVLENVKDAIEYGSIEKLYDAENDADAYELHGLNLCTVMSISTKQWKGIESIIIDADDLNSSNVMIVRLLREFFKQQGFSTRDTGDKWSGIDGNDFMSKLLSKVTIRLEK